MKVCKLNWDSDFFEKSIGEVSIENPSQKITDFDDFDLIVVKQENPFQINIPGFHQTFEETKIIFEKELKETIIQDFSAIKNTDEEPHSLEFFQNLAYESGKYSRFLLDSKFGKEKFEKLYDEWIINSLNKKFAEKLFYTEENGLATGFVTVQKSDKAAKVGLIATHPDFQGKGLGKKLLLFAEKFSLESGLTKMEIPTQKSNEGACSFYNKMGYDIKEELIIKHFWKNEL